MGQDRCDVCGEREDDGYFTIQVVAVPLWAEGKGIESGCLARLCRVCMRSLSTAGSEHVRKLRGARTN
jgi:hypothetical protein